MTDQEWSTLLADLRSIERDGELDRAIAAADRLATLDDPSRLPDLRALVESGDFFVLEAIGPPLANLDGLNSLPVLLHALERGHEQGHDCDRLSTTIIELVESDARNAASVLTEMLTSRDAKERQNAAWLLGFVAEFANPLSLSPLLSDPSPEVRGAAIGSLISFSAPFDVLELIASHATDVNVCVRSSVASALGYLGDVRAEPVLSELLHDRVAEVRKLAEYSIDRIRES